MQTKNNNSKEAPTKSNKIINESVDGAKKMAPTQSSAIDEGKKEKMSNQSNSQQSREKRSVDGAKKMAPVQPNPQQPKKTGK